MGNQAGKNGERPRKRERKGRTGEATVRRKREETERKKQRLSSEALKRKRTKDKRKSSTGPGGEI